MNKKRGTWLLVLGLATVGACALPSEGLDTQSEQETDDFVAVNLEALRHPLIEASWSSGEPARRLAPFATHVCVLSRVAGSFEGAKDEVFVTVRDDEWVLSGTTRNRVSARAICYARDEFSSSGSERWVSEEFAGAAKSDCWGGIWACGGGSGRFSVRTWQGDAATFITGIGGDLGGQRAELVVSQAAAGADNSSLAGASTIGGAIKGRVRSFFVGTPGRFAPVLFVKDARRGPASEVGEYVLEDVRAEDHVTMAQVDEAMCYLSAIGGDFDSRDAEVSIERSVGPDALVRWELRARGTQSQRLRVRARCMSLNQVPPLSLVPAPAPVHAAGLL